MLQASYDLSGNHTTNVVYARMCVYAVEGAKNDEHENDAPLKCLSMKLTNIKMSGMLQVAEYIGLD